MRKPISAREAGERSATLVDKHLGEFVRTSRLAAGISQERLAEVLGVTFQQVQKYEKGVNRIAASRLYDISIALQIHIADFFAGLPGFVERKDDGVQGQSVVRPAKRPRKKRS